jgi:hypothetical protein
VIHRFPTRVDAGLYGQPLEQLVAQESELASAREAVGRELPLSHQPPEVLDVHLEELGGHRRGQDGRELVHDPWGPMGSAA